jgi:hypothetical protein
MAKQGSRWPYSESSVLPPIPAFQKEPERVTASPASSPKPSTPGKPARSEDENGFLSSPYLKAVVSIFISRSGLSPTFPVEEIEGFGFMMVDTCCGTIPPVGVLAAGDLRQRDGLRTALPCHGTDVGARWERE